MRQTVYGIFNKASEAQTAVKHLMEEGFTENAINVHKVREGDEAGSGKSEKKSKPRERNSDGYMDFLSNLIVDRDELQSSSNVGGRASVVSVITASANESERAGQVLDRFGAIDVKEREERS